MAILLELSNRDDFETLADVIEGALENLADDGESDSPIAADYRALSALLDPFNGPEFLFPHTATLDSLSSDQQTLLRETVQDLIRTDSGFASYISNE